MHSFNQLIPLIGKFVEEKHGKFANPGTAALLRLSASVSDLFEQQTTPEWTRKRIGSALLFTCNYCYAERLKYPLYIDMDIKPDAGIIRVIGHLNLAHYAMMSGKRGFSVTKEDRDAYLCQFVTHLHNFAKERVNEDDLYLLNIYWNGIQKGKK